MAKRSKNADIDSLRQSEGDALLAAVPDGTPPVIALDERGKQWSTMELAQQMENWMREERGVCFLVGGPDGLASSSCREQAHATSGRWAA